MLSELICACVVSKKGHRGWGVINIIMKKKPLQLKGVAVISHAGDGDDLTLCRGHQLYIVSV